MLTFKWYPIDLIQCMRFRIFCNKYSSNKFSDHLSPNLMTTEWKSLGMGSEFKTKNFLNFCTESVLQILDILSYGRLGYWFVTHINWTQDRIDTLSIVSRTGHQFIVANKTFLWFLFITKNIFIEFLFTQKYLLL